MKSLLTFAVLFGVVFAFSAASDVKTQAQLKCDAKVFVQLAEEAVTDVYDFYNSVATSYEGLVEDVLQCVANYSGFTDLVSCVADTLTAWVQGVSGAIDTYATNIIKVGQELADDIYNCK